MLKLGHLFQCQDDFLDYHAPPEVLGKIGTDIQDGKCSWPVTQALNLVTPQQRQLLEQHYGKNNAESVMMVKNLYNELGIHKIYADFEDNLYQQIKSDIALIAKQTKLPNAFFENLLQKLYKRQK